MKTPTAIHGKHHCWIGVILLAGVLGVTAMIYKRKTDPDAKPGDSPVNAMVRDMRKSMVEKKLRKAGNPYAYPAGKENPPCCTPPDSWSRYAVLR